MAIMTQLARQSSLQPAIGRSLVCVATQIIAELQVVFPQLASLLQKVQMKLARLGRTLFKE
jgi:hypothetical protein